MRIDPINGTFMGQPVELPTQTEAGVFPGQDSNHAAGLAQKLIIVRPYLLVCWAGIRAEADRMVSQLDQMLPFHAPNLDECAAILKILNTCLEGTELVVLLNWQDGVYPFGVRTRGFDLGEKRIYLLGSGASDFFKYLESHPGVLPEQEGVEGITAQAIALRFAARAMMAQWIAGDGLENSWGGGFEVAYPEPGAFRKVDNLLFRAWLVDEEGAYSNSGRSFFSRYYGQDLYLSCFNPDEKTYVVRSPIGTPLSPPAFEHAHPEWTLDIFLMKHTGSFVEFARFHPAHRLAADFVELEHGKLVGWNMDKDYVQSCVETAIAQAGIGDQFTVKRY